MPHPSFSLELGKTCALPFSTLADGYASLRIAHPKMEANLAKSLTHLGQLSPIVVGLPTQGCYELLDGFKRSRILKAQGRTEILARIIPVEKRSVCKSMMLSLHGHVSGLSELEEALIVQSLHREDGMSQVEIGILVGRHKSWVNRRIALLERLSVGVREHLVLGLLPLSVGRILCQLPLSPHVGLPRGNVSQGEGNVSQGEGNVSSCIQDKMLETILKHRLSSRECEALFRHMKKSTPWEMEMLLHAPWEINPPLSSPHSGTSLVRHLKLFSKMSLSIVPKIETVLESGLTTFSPECQLHMRQADAALERCRVLFKIALETNRETNP